MARKIKLVVDNSNAIRVRNIGDTIARNETLVAARWQQNGEIKVAMAHQKYDLVLAHQAGHPEIWNRPANAGLDDLTNWEREQYD